MGCFFAQTSNTICVSQLRSDWGLPIHCWSVLFCTRFQKEQLLGNKQLPPDLIATIHFKAAPIICGQTTEIKSRIQSHPPLHIVPPEQVAYRSRHSCEDALRLASHSWSQADKSHWCYLDFGDLN
eukprot:scpid75574/ scgid30471/ 